MKLIVTYRARGQEFIDTIEGTREECYEGVRNLMREKTAATSFVSREVSEIDIAAALKPADSRHWPDNHRDCLD